MSTPDVDLKSLARLARLEISEQELSRLEKEIPDILKFVAQIQDANVSVEAKSPELHNVMRADKNPHESGVYTKRLLDAAPKVKDNRIVVRQVVSRKSARGGSASGRN